MKKPKAKSAVQKPASKSPPPAIRRVETANGNPPPLTPPFTPAQLQVIDSIAANAAKRVVAANAPFAARQLAQVLETGAAQTEVNAANEAAAQERAAKAQAAVKNGGAK